MLRLIIADDEKVIRETICSLIDWNKLGIEVVGICKDGIEAYNMILDEYPDIVMTDIRMPGMTGLELISRIAGTDSQIEFVILSGYGEFSYATEAMSHGVKHYLLKPCSEDDIIKVMEQVAADCYKKKRQSKINEQHSLMSRQMHQALVQNVLLEAISAGESLDKLIAANSLYLDFSGVPYDLCFFYYLEEDDLESVLSRIYRFCEENPDTAPSVGTLHFIYVRNTMVLFYEKIGVDAETFGRFCSGIRSEHGLSQPQFELTSYPDLEGVLDLVLKKIQRYETIYLINGTSKIAARNLNYLLAKSSECVKRMNDGDAGEAAMQELIDTLRGIDDPAYLKVILADLLLNNETSRSRNPIFITEFLLNISEYSTCREITDAFVPNIPKLFPTTETVPHRQKDFIEKTLQYIDEHLSDSNLSLKWIAENFLYMNVDYVSKQFMKQTGVKFSSYLSNLRIERAKKLLLENNTESIYTIAEEVGFGNNPQYFSQIFKKSTGMTPTTYVKAMRGDV